MHSKSFSKRRLFLIGLIMGIADLVPGISGGTVAFLSGIYETLLTSIKTLQLQSFKKNSWSFLIPLFSGIVISILLFSKVIYYLLVHFRPSLFGFFFGMGAAYSLTSGREANLNRPSCVACFLAGAVCAFLLTLLPTHLIFGTSFFGLLLAGMLGTAALLLPGVSGSFMLQLIGVYPLIIKALNCPMEAASFKLLIAIGLGIVLGFIVFSRLISALLKSFKEITLSFFVGFMVGGLKILWPFSSEHILYPLLALLLGFFVVIYFETSRKKFLNAKN